MTAIALTEKTRVAEIDEVNSCFYWSERVISRANKRRWFTVQGHAPR
jgi:hypothetical protein